jgi:hypothetical protein
LSKKLIFAAGTTSHLENPAYLSGVAKAKSEEKEIFQ